MRRVPYLLALLATLAVVASFLAQIVRGECPVP